MLILRPLKSNYTTQKFSENKACIRTDSNGRPYRPFRVIGTRTGTCPINSIPFYPTIGMKGHSGWDMSCYYKEPLFFPCQAETKWWARTEIDADGGVGIDVFSKDRVFILKLPKDAGRLARKDWEDNEHRVYIKLRFWHLHDIKIGDKSKIEIMGQMKPEIKLGDMIGWCDSTGASSANHLHWGFKIVTENALTLDSDNGYYGAMDFLEWYQDIFILDLLGRKRNLTPQQILRRMAWEIRNIDRKLARILRSVAGIISAFGTRVGTILKANHKIL